GSEREGGWIDKFEGDAALAVFGVPSAHLDHADAGLRAARAIVAGVRVLEIDVGIGVTTGPVVAGNVGTERRHEFTVIGRPVNQAARLADLAKRRPERVLASMDAINASGTEASHWKVCDTVLVRGIDAPVAVGTRADLVATGPAELHDEA